MPSALFIVNPHAGNKSITQKDIEVMKNILAKKFHSIKIVRATSEKVARNSVKKWVNKVDAICFAGGDGTLNAVINGVPNIQKPIGIIPVGTTNVLAQEFSIPLDAAKACEIIAAGRTLTMDAGVANDRVFVMSCGIGLDAHVISKVPPALKKFLGPAAFELTGIRELLFYQPPKIHIKTPEIELDGYFIIVNNTKLYGGKMISSNPDLHDGLFEVVVLTKPDMLYFFKNYLGVSKTKPPKFSEVETFQTSELTITHYDEQASTQVDGEVMGATPVYITMKPNALTFFVP